MDDWSDSLPAPPALGYRGCYLQDAGLRKWTAFKGYVTLDQEARTQVRKDTDSVFEKLLLSSAPQGKLPPWLNKQES
jgi:hypothetical protein